MFLVTLLPSQVDFDLSDSSLSFVNNEVSYSAFDFNLYSDIDLNNLFFTSGKTDDFNISLSGRIGIDATAVLTIKNVEQIQKDLYYNLTPINDDLNTDIKKEIIRDTDNNVNSNSLVFSSNPLTGSHTLVGVGSTTFLFSAPKSPKKLEYSSSDGDFSYDSSKTKAQGPIAGINLRSKGKQYRTIPGISTIRSYEGRDAILKPESTTIGRISNVDIQNIGFDYSADNTLRPQAQIPHLIKIDALASIRSIGISSVGTSF
jgi:hypothetical protein